MNHTLYRIFILLSMNLNVGITTGIIILNGWVKGDWLKPEHYKRYRVMKYLFCLALFGFELLFVLVPILQIHMNVMTGGK